MSGDVARILRRRAAAGGVEGEFGGHSLRRDFITNAAEKKIPVESIKRVTGHRSTGVVLEYVAGRDARRRPATTRNCSFWR
jgi:integrase